MLRQMTKDDEGQVFVLVLELAPRSGGYWGVFSLCVVGFSSFCSIIDRRGSLLLIWELAARRISFVFLFLIDDHDGLLFSWALWKRLLRDPDHARSELE